MQDIELLCVKCKYFRQHYVKMGYRYATANCGHCIYPRLKHRTPQHKACGHYKEKSPEHKFRG